MDNHNVDLAYLYLYQVLRIRHFEEKCAELYSAGNIRGFLHLYIGEEAIAAAAFPHFKEQDAIVATYREHGQALARGISMNKIMAEMFGKITGCSRGRGGSMHLFDKEKNFYGGNAIVASGLPLATGLALANKMQKKDNITVCLFGDGAVAEGEFHEAMNLAALWSLPVFFICENNLYAMGTALSRAQSQVDLAAKARSYNMEAHSVDGMDPFAIGEIVERLTAEIRRDGKPRFLECKTYRFRPHSMFDPDLYRDKKEIEEWKKRGPVTHIRNFLEEKNLWSEAKFNELEKRISDEIEQATAFAKNSEYEPISEINKFLYG